MITSSATSQNWKMWDQKGKKVNDKMWKAKLIFSICCLLECSGGYESKHHLIIPKKNPKKKKAWRPSVGQKHLTKVQPFPYQTRIVHFDWHLGSKAWKKTTTIVKGPLFPSHEFSKVLFVEATHWQPKKISQELDLLQIIQLSFWLCVSLPTHLYEILISSSLSLSLSLSLSQWVLWVGLHGLFPFLAFWFFLSWKERFLNPPLIMHNQNTSVWLITFYAGRCKIS